MSWWVRVIGPPRQFVFQIRGQRNRTNPIHCRNVPCRSEFFVPARQQALAGRVRPCVCWRPWCWSDGRLCRWKSKQRWKRLHLRQPAHSRVCRTRCFECLDGVELNHRDVFVGRGMIDGVDVIGLHDAAKAFFVLNRTQKRYDFDLAALCCLGFAQFFVYVCTGNSDNSNNSSLVGRQLRI